VKFVPRIWRSAFSVRQKLQATLHLSGYTIHLLLLSLSLLYPLLLAEATRYPTLLSLFSFLALTNVAGFAPMAMFTAGQQQLERRWWRLVPIIFMLSLLGAGMMLTTARAAWRALIGRRSAFERTPKFGIGAEGKDWMRLRYQSPIDLIVVPELALAAVNFSTSYTAVGAHAWPIAVYTAIFGLGLAFTAGLTIYQGLGRRLKAPRAQEAFEATAAGS
jgi:hypothetical protein